MLIGKFWEMTAKESPRFSDASMMYVSDMDVVHLFVIFHYRLKGHDYKRIHTRLATTYEGNGCTEFPTSSRLAAITQGAENRRRKGVCQYNHLRRGLGLFILSSLIAVEYIHGSGSNSTAQEN
jgi:hypothetical protein